MGFAKTAALMPRCKALAILAASPAVLAECRMAVAAKTWLALLLVPGRLPLLESTAVPVSTLAFASLIAARCVAETARLLGKAAGLITEAASVATKATRLLC